MQRLRLKAVAKHRILRVHTELSFRTSPIVCMTCARSDLAFGGPATLKLKTKCAEVIWWRTQSKSNPVSTPQFPLLTKQGIFQFWARSQLRGRHSSNDLSDLEQSSLLNGTGNFCALYISASDPGPRPGEAFGRVAILLVVALPHRSAARDDLLGWRAHSVRGALSGALKKKLRLTIESLKV